MLGLLAWFKMQWLTFSCQVIYQPCDTYVDILIAKLLNKSMHSYISFPKPLTYNVSFIKYHF